MMAGVLHRQHSAPAVSEDRHRLKPEMAAHPVQVIHFGLDGDVGGSDAVGGPPATALIVIDHPESLGQAIQLGQQIVVAEVWPAVQHDDRRALADVAEMQSRAAGRYEPGARFHAGSLWPRPRSGAGHRWRVPTRADPREVGARRQAVQSTSGWPGRDQCVGRLGRRWPEHARPVIGAGVRRRTGRAVAGRTNMVTLGNRGLITDRAARGAAGSVV